MTVKELIDALNTFVKADEYRASMLVTFSPENANDVFPVNGGAVLRNNRGLAVLNLAPIKLDLVGGF